MVRPMHGMSQRRCVTADAGPRVPSHVPSGAALLAVRLSEEARGVRGLDVLRRSVERAPPVRD